MTDDIRQRAIALFDAFTHVHNDRRTFMAELTLLAGGAVAANALLASIAPDPAAAAVIAANDIRIRAQEVSWSGANGHVMKGYSARPAGVIVKRPAVMVIHENRGLNDHIRDVARRVALAGFVAVAPDFLSPVGGTPVNEDKAREMIGKLDLAATVGDAVATVGWLRRVSQSTGKVGTVGFCWGGAMANRVAVGAGTALSGAVAYYGPAPDPKEAARVKAAMMLHYAGLDDRVNATGKPWIEALKAAGAPTEAFVYDGVNHAFNNDTSGERYNKGASDLAWGRTIGFLKTRLA
ncbi:MAG: dienelactone hydrolase family protein [Sphingomonadales bacterium]